VLDETTPLVEAQPLIEQAKELIRELEGLLPASPQTNFRERLVEHLETLGKKTAWDDADLKFRLKADALLVVYERVFGVNDLVDNPWTALS
jgi:hypothetical protein